MPVAKKTKKKKKATTRSSRQPSTVTINAPARSRKVKRSGSATIVTAGGRGATLNESGVAAKGTRSGRTRKGGKDHGDLPSWGQLEAKVNRKLKVLEGSPLLEAVPTVRFALILAMVAAAFTLYVGHVHATQELLAETQAARKENHRLHLKYNRVKGEFDRLTGPAEIHRRAQALGFVEDAAYGQTIVVDD